MPNDPAIKLLRQINSLLLLYQNDRWERISDLTFAQVFLLNEIFDTTSRSDDRLSLSVLSKQTGFSKPAICSMLKVLKKADYIRTDVDREDNRRKEILLTQKAQLAKTDIDAFICNVSETICQGMSNREVTSLKRSLQKILANMQKAKIKKEGRSKDPSSPKRKKGV